MAVHRGPAGCSDTTAVNPTTQQYASTRQSAFGDAMSLRNTWSHALALSPERLEIWRNDLVRTVEYGEVPAPQESGFQPRSGCTLGTAGLDDERFAVTERCPGDASERLTISKTVPEDSREPEEVASDVTGADGLWILTTGKETVTALQRRGDAWSVEVFSSPTEHRTVHELGSAPERMPDEVSVSTDDEQVRWFDGRSTHAFDRDTGEHEWTVDDTTGPGIAWGFGTGVETSPDYPSTIVPVPGGLLIASTADGEELGMLRFDRPSGDVVTGLAQVGDILYERRADGIHAYKLAG